MKQMEGSQTRLKSLLRELFQLDVADLDFGLYRLFRLKRHEVEAFLEKQLPAEVDHAFEAVADAEREALHKRLDELADRARTTVADDAILPSGEPNPAHAKTKAVREYAEARSRLEAVEPSEAQRAEVFNLLYAFFSRYYDEGDFIPRRFYGARARYAVPYNGEEVFFHWANKDQHYRLPTEAEAAKYGKNSKAQEAILDEAAPKILEAIQDESLHAALSAPSPSGESAEGEAPPTLLRRRLRHFTKKNTTDYFIHKDLNAFLRQELEFFVRDQVVHEADLEGDFEAKRRTIRVFRKLAETLITFLAQVEDAQKRLFEKKKFVLRTDYLIPIQNVPCALWPEVLANKAQLAEWENLGFAGNAGVPPAIPGLFHPPDATATTALPAQPKGWHSRGYLPHFEGERLVQFITFRLHDSVPAEQVERWKHELHWVEVSCFRRNWTTAPRG